MKKLLLKMVIGILYRNLQAFVLVSYCSVWKVYSCKNEDLSLRETPKSVIIFLLYVFVGKRK